MGAWIDGLVDKGSAVAREADPLDRRVWNVVLTPAGHTLWAETARIDRSIRRVLRDGNTAEDRARLDALLTLVNRNADAPRRRRRDLTGCITAGRRAAGTAGSRRGRAR